MTRICFMRQKIGNELPEYGAFPNATYSNQDLGKGTLKTFLNGVEACPAGQGCLFGELCCLPPGVLLKKIFVFDHNRTSINESFMDSMHSFDGYVNGVSREIVAYTVMSMEVETTCETP